MGYGCSYTPPIQALIDWFPDKRGLASGVVIAGFGSGALFFTPAMNAMMQKVIKNRFLNESYYIHINFVSFESENKYSSTNIYISFLR